MFKFDNLETMSYKLDEYLSKINKCDTPMNNLLDGNDNRLAKEMQQMNEYLRKELKYCVDLMSDKHKEFYVKELKSVIEEDVNHDGTWKEYSFKDDEQRKRMQTLRKNLRLLLNDIEDLCDIDT